MIFEGNSWKPDIMEKALVAVEDVAELYEVEAKRLNTCIAQAEALNDIESLVYMKRLQKKCMFRCFRLRSERGRRQCLKMSRENKIYLLPKAFRQEYFNGSI